MDPTTSTVIEYQQLLTSNIFNNAMMRDCPIYHSIDISAFANIDMWFEVETD